MSYLDGRVESRSYGYLSTGYSPIQRRGYFDFPSPPTITLDTAFNFLELAAKVALVASYEMAKAYAYGPEPTEKPTGYLSGRNK